MLGPMLACSNATIIAFVDQMLGVSVPSRMYNVMAAGVPLIAISHPQSELSLVTEESDCGWVLPLGNDAALEQLVREIHSEAGKSIARQKGRNGRAAVEKRYSFTVIGGRYRSILEQRLLPKNAGNTARQI